MDSRGHLSSQVAQREIDYTGGHKVNIPHGTEGTDGDAMERASGPHAPA